MTSVLLLYILAVVDVACCGYRAAGGRVATLDKRAYFTDAMLNGVIAGHLVLLIMSVALAVVFSTEPDKVRFGREMERSAGAALSIYVPYATLVFVAMLMRLLPSIDVKSIACTVLLGPLLFIRPFVAAAGILYAASVVADTRLVVVALLVLALMLVFEGLMERWYEARGASA